MLVNCPGAGEGLDERIVGLLLPQGAFADIAGALSNLTSLAELRLDSNALISGPLSSDGKVSGLCQLATVSAATHCPGGLHTHTTSPLAQCIQS